MFALSCASVRLPVRAAHWFAGVRDAVPLLHRPALRSDAPLPLPHPAAVHPQRDQHPEIHQVSYSLWKMQPHTHVLGLDRYWYCSKQNLLWLTEGVFYCRRFFSLGWVLWEYETQSTGQFYWPPDTLDCSDIDISIRIGKVCLCKSMLYCSDSTTPNIHIFKY